MYSRLRHKNLNLCRTSDAVGIPYKNLKKGCDNMLYNEHLTKEENKVLNEIVGTFMVALAEDELEVINDCREFPEALIRLSESMLNYGITLHEDIDEFIKEYIAEKYNINEDEEILMYLESEEYFKEIYLETQDRTVCFQVENTPTFIEVWEDF